MHLDSHDTPRFRTVTGGGTGGGTDLDGTVATCTSSAWACR